VLLKPLSMVERGWGEVRVAIKDVIISAITTSLESEPA
jgi:hypothetical protein